MNINKNSWHYKLYSWYKGYETHSTNLCPYVRTVLFYAPIKFSFVGWIWKIPATVVIWLPLLVEFPRWTGMISYPLKIVILCLYLIIAIVATIIGIFWLWTEVFDLDNPAVYISRVIGHPLKSKPVTSIFTVIKEYWKAFHDGICPVIYFD